MPEHRGSRAMRRMIEIAPFSGSLALWVQHRDAESKAQVPPIVTDGQTITYGAGYEYLSLPQQMGLLAHELLHIALRHPQRFAALGDADLRLYTICADAIVNSALSHVAWLELPPSSVYLEHILTRILGLHLDAEKALGEWNVERLYRAIDDRKEASNGQHTPSLPFQSKQRSGGGGGTDEKDGSGHGTRHTESRQDGATSAQVRQMGARVHADLIAGGVASAPSESEAEEAQAWAARLAHCQSGDGTASILRGLTADLPHSRVPWELVLRTRLARALSRRASLTWSRPSRSYIANQGRSAAGQRMPYEPGRSQSSSVPRIAIIIDVSGSIADGVLAQFSREIAAISRRQEAALTLVIGDDQVREVRCLAPGESTNDGLQFTGGGGTDFTPLLEEANSHSPDIGVVLSDLDGPARFRPAWPVIWAVPARNAMAVPPFGTKLVLA